MPTLVFQAVLSAPLQRVWEFHNDVLRVLPAISPPEARVAIESADLPMRAGSRVIVLARGPLGKKLRWVSIISIHEPPHVTPTGEQARFADDQESGPFAAWRHEHVFDRIDDTHTRMTDRVTYRVGLGPIGWLADHLLVRRQIRTMFAHRHEVTERMLGVVSGEW